MATRSIFDRLADFLDEIGRVTIVEHTEPAPTELEPAVEARALRHVRIRDSVPAADSV
jgi:hypothetical protein